MGYVFKLEFIAPARKRRLFLRKGSQALLLRKSSQTFLSWGFYSQPHTPTTADVLFSIKIT